MSITDELRTILDERGVEWWPSDERWNEDGITHWYAGILKWTAIEDEDGLWLNAGVAGHNSLTPEQAIAATLGPVITGDTSDGYHTFNELYHHRAVLFSVIVRDHAVLAWKSKAHHDGTMYDGMFIVGIETSQGQATYHYDIDPYWEMFECKELDRAPEWDGHTPDEAIARIATLSDADATCERQGDAGTCRPREVRSRFSMTQECVTYHCECGHELGGYMTAELPFPHTYNEDSLPNFCPNCGRRIEVDG